MFTKYLPYIVIIILIGAICIQQCSIRKSNQMVLAKSDTLSKIDTMFVLRDTIIYKPDFKYITLQDTAFQILPTDTIQIINSYLALNKEYNSKRIYSDTLKVDSSYIAIRDTLQHNRILSRTYNAHWKLPVITKTVTITNEVYKPRTQVYFGVGAMGNTSGINHIALGLALKTKKDFIIGANAGIDYKGQLIYGVNGYWKLK